MHSTADASAPDDRQLPLCQLVHLLQHFRGQLSEGFAAQPPNLHTHTLLQRLLRSAQS